MNMYNIGVVGCGKISDIYLQNLATFPYLQVTACAALDSKEAQQQANRYAIPKACTPDEIFFDPDIDCVLNLTVPSAHASVTKRSLENNKHVYSEKPFVVNLSEGKALLELAASKGLSVGCAPDTFLGGRWQNVRKLLDEDLIGTPIGVHVFVGTHGVERHHPNPDFYYQSGGGPLFDLGPYYLTAMVFLFGPIAHVAGMSSRGFSKRMIENGPRHGEWMPVEVDTHSLCLLDFANGIKGTMTMSFDVWDSENPRFEIYGTTGTICIPDPDPVFGANIFGGEVWYRQHQHSRWSHQPRPTGREDWQVATHTFGYNHNARGLGLLEMVHALAHNRPPRASAALAMHVCEVMQSIENAACSHSYQHVASRPQRPQPLPTNFPA